MKSNKFTPKRCNKLESQILTTWGMSSAVFNPKPGNNSKYQFIGHIFAGDYDGEDFHYVLDEAMKNMYVNDELISMFPKIYPKIGWYDMFPGISANNQELIGKRPYQSSGTCRPGAQRLIIPAALLDITDNSKRGRY